MGDMDTEIPAGSRQEEAFCSKSHSQRNRGSRQEISKPYPHLQLWMTFLICKAPRRCFPPKMIKVSDFHETKRKRVSCKISWNKFNGYKQSGSLFEVSIKPKNQKNKAPPSYSYSIHLLTQGPVTTLLRPRLAAPGWSRGQTLNHQWQVSGTWAEFGGVPFRSCPGLGPSTSGEMTRPRPGVPWLQATPARQWSQTEVTFITKCLRC